MVRNYQDKLNQLENKIIKAQLPGEDSQILRGIIESYREELGSFASYCPARQEDMLERLDMDISIIGAHYRF